MNEQVNADKKEHLKIIEDVITRMANNSFLIKGWTVSLISAILIFADLKNEPCFIWIVILPVIVFWILDASYLQLERKYRTLYKNVQQDFLYDLNNVPLFEMNTKDIKVDCIFKIMFSKTIMPIYTIIIIATAVSWIIKCL